MLTAATMTKIPNTTATLSVAFDTNRWKAPEAFAGPGSLNVFLKLAILWLKETLHHARWRKRYSNTVTMFGLG